MHSFDQTNNNKQPFRSRPKKYLRSFPIIDGSLDRLIQQHKSLNQSLHKNKTQDKEDMPKPE